MKRIFALLLAFCLIASCALGEPTGGAKTAETGATESQTGTAEGQIAPTLPVVLNTGDRTRAESYEELIVGSTTKLSGQFFTDLFGNNTSDADVRDLIHGYALTYWDAARGAFVVDTSVVSGMTATLDQSGNKVYTIALADDLTYNDGSKITARDYVFSVLLTASKAFSELGATGDAFSYVVGWNEYRAKDGAAFSGVRLLDEDTFSITVQKGALPYFYELSYLNIAPAPIDVIAPGCAVSDEGEGAKIVNAKKKKKAVYTTALLKKSLFDAKKGYASHPKKTCGPYTLKAYDAKTGVAKFEINERYKGDVTGKKPTIARLVLKPVTNETAAEALRSGEIDLINKCVDPDGIGLGTALVAEERARVANYMRVGLTMISFCCEAGALSSQAVRQAVAYAFDKEDFVARQVKNYGVAVDGYYGIGQWMTQLVGGTLQPPVAQPAEDADAATVSKYESDLAAWQAINFDNLPKYDFNASAASALLDADGWNLNADGESYRPGVDETRYRESEGERMPLALTLYIPEGNKTAAEAGRTLTEGLKAIGASLTVEEKPFDELLEAYYRKTVRACDMIYMSTNFASAFNPAATFSASDEAQRVKNVTGIDDPKLVELAQALNQTESGDLLNYCRKWVALQERIGETLPMLPLFSSVYFDFYTPRLQNYNIASFGGWAQAILYAYLGDPAVQPEETAPAATDEETVTIIE